MDKSCLVILRYVYTVHMVILILILYIQTTNRNISILFLAFLIPAFVCNLIFSINNFNEHRENEETFKSTPITYDALFVGLSKMYISTKLHPCTMISKHIKTGDRCCIFNCDYIFNHSSFLIL